jgi:hypothetical protein
MNIVKPNEYREKGVANIIPAVLCYAGFWGA